MKSVAVVALLASSAFALQLNPRPGQINPPAPRANSHYVGTSPVRARLHISQSKMRRQTGGRVYKRCKPHSGPSSAAAAATTTPAVASSANAAPTSSAAPAITSSTSSGGGSSGGSSGKVINVQTSGCGDIGATAKTSKTTGPNGSETWLNCGIGSGGWNPPKIRITDLVYKDLAADISSGNSIFKPCAPYSSMINSAADQTGLPAIMIASIMMQESTCNKDTVGGGGEQGLMQITKDKCGGAPGGNCMDPAFNILTGSKYLASQIKSSDDNVLLAVGSYNGWYKGLTYDGATAAAKTSCCRCQNNLDYPHQFFNGWMQGIDAYSTDLGTYKNLDKCGN